MTSLINGQYNADMELFYIGHVTLGVSCNKLLQYKISKIDKPLIANIPAGNDGAIWLQPKLVVTVEYMYNDNNNLRQPVFRGFRDDKLPTECIKYHDNN
jgi:ATP-dependent DNA ligase